MDSGTSDDENNFSYSRNASMFQNFTKSLDVLPTFILITIQEVITIGIPIVQMRNEA